ncbi:carbohydrate kinase family protein [Actinophytocola sediminis]
MLCVGGEALIDLVPAAETPPGELGPLRPLPGGGPYNVAVTLGRLGAPVAFLSRLSTDTFGEVLLDRLRVSGVDVSLVQRGAEPTTLAVTGIGQDGSASYSFHVEATADRLVTDPGELPAAVTILSLGTLSMVLEPGATTYETLLRRHSARGGLVVVDPNIRAAMITDPDAYRARFTSWLPDIGLLKLSVEDAAWLAGGEHAIEDTVRGWLVNGPAAAVLTRGGDGLVALTAAGDRIEVPTVPAVVVDTIGAGDTVHGALLHWLEKAGISDPAGVREIDADGWHNALEFAALAASVTVSRAGAEPPYTAELAVHP